eukprot:9304390-Pyramimonas_sp.AAC.1
MLSRKSGARTGSRLKTAAPDSPEGMQADECTHELSFPAFFYDNVNALSTTDDPIVRGIGSGKHFAYALLVEGSSVLSYRRKSTFCRTRTGGTD